MPNIHLTYKREIKTKNENRTDRKAVLKLAWFFVETENVNISYALKRAWKETKGELERNFWTDAPLEQIDFMIRSCSNKERANPIKVRKWDSVNIEHPLDWLSYQLKRQGFKITRLKNDHIIKRNIVPMDINLLKCPNGFNKEKNSFKLNNDSFTYCFKNGYIPNY